MAYIRANHVDLDYPVFAPPAAGRPARNEKAGLIRGPGALIPSGQQRISHVRALRDVSFEIRSGERVGIVGRNGSGKSTLLRVLAEIYEPSAGSVEVEGAVAPLFNVGLGTRPEASGRRNIILRGVLRGLSRAEAEAKVDEIVEFSELEDFIDLPVRTYSSGMAMRLSFSIATAFSPEILLLDEWLGAGDKQFEKKANARMKRMVDDAGITVIASHNRSLLREVCSCALWLDKGELRAVGPIDEVYARIDEEDAG